MNDKKWLFFDIGRVVMSTDFRSLYSNFAKRAGISSDFVAQYHKNNFDQLMTGEISMDQFLEDMRAEGNNSYTAPELLQFWREEGTPLRVMNDELIEWIKSNNEKYHMATLTNLSPGRLLLDEDIKLYEPFELNILSCIEGVAKPDLAIYQRALEKAGTEAGNAIFIDDRADYVAGAKAAGIKDILYIDNSLLFAQLKELGIE